jgi:hypothetical protein
VRRIEHQSSPEPELKLKVQRVLPAGADSRAIKHDLPGPPFRLLSKDVAYLKLSSVKTTDAASYVEQAAGTKALIIDIRNYPSDFMVFALDLSWSTEKPRLYAVAMAIWLTRAPSIRRSR